MAELFFGWTGGDIERSMKDQSLSMYRYVQ